MCSMATTLPASLSEEIGGEEAEAVCAKSEAEGEVEDEMVDGHTSSANTAVRYPDPLPTSRTRAPGWRKGRSEEVAAACMWGAEMVAWWPIDWGDFVFCEVSFWMWCWRATQDVRDWGREGIWGEG